MRRTGTIMALLAVLLILAACGGGGDEGDNEQDTTGGGDTPPVIDAGGEDAGDPADDGAEAADNANDAGATGAEETGGSSAVDGVPPTPQQAPPVGVLATPGATAEVEPDPEEPQEAPDPEGDAPTTGFDYLYFQQEGGINNQNIVIEIYSDGRVVQDGQELPVPPERIEELATQIDTVDFFNMIATFLGPPPAQNDYRYLLFVRRGGAERSIRAQDGFTPEEVMRLFSLIRGINQDARQAAGV